MERARSGRGIEFSSLAHTGLYLFSTANPLDSLLNDVNSFLIYEPANPEQWPVLCLDLLNQIE